MGRKPPFSQPATVAGSKTTVLACVRPAFPKPAHSHTNAQALRAHEQEPSLTPGGGDGWPLLQILGQTSFLAALGKISSLRTFLWQRSSHLAGG